MKHPIALFAMMLFVPWALHAEEAMNLTREKPSAESKKFYALDSARSDTKRKQSGMIIGNERKGFVLRTDREQVDKGFIRIDRAKSVPVPTQHAIPKPQVITPEPAPVEAASVAVLTPEEQDIERESEEIEGNTESHDPVLALFDAGEDDDLLSFAEAMRGERTVSGRARHRFWPVPLSIAQRLSSGYGMRKDPFHGRPTFHGGIDISAPTGTPVLATADGQVIQVQSDGNYGKYITLQHNDGTLSRYGHLSAQNVMLGQQVKGGQAIGKIGSTGRSTGAHLDYRVSKNGMKFDPLAILRVPPEVEYKGIKPVAVASNDVRDATPRSRVASKPLPKRPMVIKVQ